MTDDLREFVRRCFDAFNRRDVAFFRANSVPDVIVVPLRAAVEGITFRGPDAWDRFFATSAEAWKSLQAEIETLEVRGERLLVTGVLAGVSRATGTSVHTQLGWIVTLRDGRIAELRTYPTDLAARAAF